MNGFIIILPLGYVTSPPRMAFTHMSSTHTTLSIFCPILLTFKIEKIILSLRIGELCLVWIRLELTWSFHILLLCLLTHSLMHKSFLQTAPIVWTQFVITGPMSPRQWICREWVGKLGFSEFKLQLSQVQRPFEWNCRSKREKILNPRSFIFILIDLCYMQSFLSFSLFPLLFIKDSLHYIVLFGSS